MADSLPLEENLNDLFTKKAPALPAGGKKVIVEWAPWLALIGGIASVWTAWVLWHWAHVANAFVDYANSLSAVYGGPTVNVQRMSVGIWLGIAVLAAEGVLYLLAFNGLREHRKSAWNLIYLGALLNVVYGVVVMFTSYGGAGNLIGSLIGSAIGLYFLFQVRSAYVGSRVPEAPATPKVDA
jgi:hypothetical protein